MVWGLEILSFLHVLYNILMRKLHIDFNRTIIFQILREARKSAAAGVRAYVIIDASVSYSMLWYVTITCLLIDISTHIYRIGVSIYICIVHMYTVYTYMIIYVYHLLSFSQILKVIFKRWISATCSNWLHGAAVFDLKSYQIYIVVLLKPDFL